MKKLSLLFALLCASVMGFAIDWSVYDWIGDGAGGGAYSNKYKVAPAEGQNVVNIQQPGWASEPGIYTSDFGGAISSCSLGDKCAIDGGGVVLYLSAFTAKETEVTVVAALGTKTFTVFYVDGMDGGSSCTDETAPSVSAVSVGDITYNSAVLTITAADNDGGSGISQYIVKNGDTKIASSTSSNVITLTNLSAGTTYNNIKVFAKDGCDNESLAFAVDAFQTLNRPSECSGNLGHFANPDVKRISYTIEYLPVIDKIKYTVRGYNTEVLSYLEIRTTSGNSAVLGITDGVAIWFQDAPDAATEMAIQFYYGVESIGEGREITCQNVALNDAKAVYYRSHDCSSASYPTIIPAAPDDKNDCQMFSIFGTEGFGSNATGTYGWDGAKSYLTGKIDGKDVFYTTAGTTANIQYAEKNINDFDKLHFDIWTDAAREIGVELCINAGTHGNKQNITTTAGEWKSVDLDITGFHDPKDVNTTFFFLSSLARETYYVTNVYLYKTAADESCYANCGINVALNKFSEAGCETGAANSAAKANDGNNSEWQTGAVSYENQWWYVDLSKIYNLDKITITFENARSNHFLLQGRNEAPNAAQKADDASWTTLREVTDEPLGDYALNEYDVSGKFARYIRFKSLSNTYSNDYGCKIREFSVCVTGIADVDTEKPSMISASVVSNTSNKAIIAVSASDNKGIASYHVVDAGHSFDNNFTPEGGNITVTGLTASTSYSFTITAVDFFGNESENSELVNVTTPAYYTEPQAAATAPTWDASLVRAIYSPTYSADCNFANWGGCVAYTDDTYGKKFAMGAECWGFGLDAYTLNCLNMEKLHADIWIADNASLRLVPIYGGTGLDTDDTHGKMVNLNGQQWNSIDLDLATDYAGLNLSSIFQFKIDNANGLTIWIGNLYFYRETAIVDGEAPTDVSASLASTGFYAVKITAQAKDNSGAVNFKVMNGEDILATGAAVTNVATTIPVNNLASGTAYNLNVVAYDEAGNEAAPVVVAATTKTIPAPAPALDFGNKKVVAVFTDAMACAVSGIQSGGWGETTQVEWLDIAEGDKVFYGQNFNYAGWHSWAGGDIDATGMQFLHVDIYSTGMTAVNVTPISPGHEGSATINLTPNAWTSYDVPLSAYDANNIDWAHIFQFKFMGPVGGNELMIDNVYFWSYQVTPNAAQGTDAGGWATFASPVDLAVPAGLTAYKASYEKTETEEILNLSPISVIPANAGVILKGTAGEAYTFAPTTEPAPDMSDNVLVGCVTRTDVSAVRATKDIFCMRYSGSYDFTGFFLYEGQYVPAGKAYLPLDKVSGPNNAPRKVRFVIKNEQTTTGVENADSATVEAVKFIENGQLFIRRGEAVYNLQGVRVK